MTDAERIRLETDGRNWKRWGPYVSERAWGTVREDYSPHGTAWEYFPHDHARSRAYRWSEDGLAGISDEPQLLCLAFAFWNGRDPILKERIFGLTGNEGNHGEDAKEYWWYLDSTPTHSYMKWRYVYPQGEFPYAWLVQENLRRGRGDPEFELIDTGVFDEDRYWDITVEYAKASPDDVCARVTVRNAGPEEATLDVLPTLWFRNTWSWEPDAVKPTLMAKDGINDHVVHGLDTVNPDQAGTKASLRYRLTVAPGATTEIRLRLTDGEEDLGAGFEATFAARQREADEFYASLTHAGASPELAMVMRQAFAGMLWSKQLFHYDVEWWLEGDPTEPPPPPDRLTGRNSAWRHLSNHDVISMPDKWEYPWYAAWDLAFHTVALAHLDPKFAKDQLILLLREWYMHPNGQLPAYEWAFGDVNPPVHAWAALRVFEIDGSKDYEFLERVMHKLLLNFTWWVNRKDSEGNNVFEGGFLGLDNIGPIDRSAPLPAGIHLEQSDGTAWMAMYCLNLWEISLTLAHRDDTYEDLAVKFFEHFALIASAMYDQGLWDEGDGFYYDVLHLGGGELVPLRVRSMVGLLPLAATTTLGKATQERLPEFARAFRWFLANRPRFADVVGHANVLGKDEGRLFSIVDPDRLRRILAVMLDEDEFLSPHGLRALSRHHAEHPFELPIGDSVARVDYEPGESTTGLFGGNSNWRGPIWFPVNYLVIEALRVFHRYLGDEWTIELPTGSGRHLTLSEVADELASRLVSLFLDDAEGRRPVFGPYAKFQRDPAWHDMIPFHEYFHGDTGQGLGASHQTGWTGLVADLIVRHMRKVGSDG